LIWILASLWVELYKLLSNIYDISYIQSAETMIQSMRWDLHTVSESYLLGYKKGRLSLHWGAETFCFLKIHIKCTMGTIMCISLDLQTFSFSALKSVDPEEILIKIILNLFNMQILPVLCFTNLCMHFSLLFITVMFLYLV